MPVHSHQKKKRRESPHMKFKSIGNHDEFLERITKTLYYSKLPLTERFSLPLSEFAVEVYSEVKLGRSLERLRIEDASEITRNACISPCSLVLAVIYLEQLKASNPAYVDKVAPSELFVISLMVASKFLNDNGEEDDVLNSEWAVSANIPLTDLNRLEKEFLTAIDWKVFVKNDEFWQKLRSLETRLALNEGRKRGWFSYTELEVLLDHLNAFLLAQAVFTVSAVCLASYAAGMLTVIGSTMVATHLMHIPTQSSLIHIPPSDWLSQDSSSLWQDLNRIEEFNKLEELPLFNSSNFEYCSGLDFQQKLLLLSMVPKDSEDFINESASNFYSTYILSATHNFINIPVQSKQSALFLLSK